MLPLATFGQSKLSVLYVFFEQGRRVNFNFNFGFYSTCSKPTIYE